MGNRFNINESEKNRIRGLHSLIKEQQVDVEIEPVVVDPEKPIDPRTPDSPLAGGGGPCMEIWATVCNKGTGQFPVGQVFHSPCPEVDGQWATPALVGQPFTIANCGNCTVGVIDSVSPNPNYPAANTPNGYFTTNTSCDGGLGETTYDCEIGPLTVGAGTCTQVQGSGGQYPTLQACQAACNQEKRFACVPKVTGPDPILDEASQTTQTMVCIQQANGPYTSMAQCQENCGRKKRYCINCSESQMSVIGPNDEGCPAGFVEILGNPSNFQPPCYECDGQGGCNGPGWFNGGPTVFNSQSDCLNGAPGQPACQPQGQDYDCVGAQGCVAVALGSGQFTGPNALSDCQAMCNVDPCPAFLQGWTWWQQIQSSGPKPCNNICQKIETWIDTNITDPTQYDCYMDYAVSQAQAQNCTCQPPSAFINQKTNHYNNHGCCGELSPNQSPPGPYSCGWNTGNVKPNSVCGWFDAQCTGGGLGWMKQTKCDWLDNTILTNCNCSA